MVRLRKRRYYGRIKTQNLILAFFTACFFTAFLFLFEWGNSDIMRRFFGIQFMSLKGVFIPLWLTGLVYAILKALNKTTKTFKQDLAYIFLLLFSLKFPWPWLNAATRFGFSLTLLYLFWQKRASTPNPTKEEHFSFNKQKVGLFILLPLTIYLVAFLIFTYPALFSFSSTFFTDTGDGPHDIRGFWWTRHALWDLKTNPWITNTLTFPSTISLVSDTFVPLYGLIGTCLQFFLSLTQAFNAVVVFSFLLAGLSTFWLSWFYTGSYAGSLIAGGVYTFSTYHYNSIGGQLHVLSIEWLPLFVLSWLAFVKKPTKYSALFPSLTLLAIQLTSYYTFIYALLFLLFYIGWEFWKGRTLSLLLDLRGKTCFSLFIIFSTLFCAPITITFLKIFLKDGWSGEHHPSWNSMDLLSPFFHERWFTFSQFANITSLHTPVGVENSRCLFLLSPVLFSIFAFFNKRHRPSIKFWAAVILFFFILSLGPQLLLAGISLPLRGLYDLLTFMFPLLRLTGVPMRFLLPSILGVALLTSWGVAYLLSAGNKGKITFALVFLLMVFEYWPKPIPRNAFIIPSYITVLEKQNGKGGVLDLVTPQRLVNFYQITHQKPIVLGFLSRVQLSVETEREKILEAYHSGNYSILKERFFIQYLITTKVEPTLHRLYSDGAVQLYEL